MTVTTNFKREVSSGVWGLGFGVWGLGRQLRELEKLEQKLTESDDDADADDADKGDKSTQETKTETKGKQVKEPGDGKISKAPDPASSPESDVDSGGGPNLDEMSMDQYAAHREKQERARNH